MIDNKIYKVLGTLVVVSLLSYVAINWTNIQEQLAAVFSSIESSSTTETTTNPNSPPPPPPPPPAENQPPQVNAGPDQTVSLATGAVLNGVITDDGKPNPPALVGIFWNSISGPEPVIFTALTSATTNATFSSEGNYVLRLTAFDGEFLVTDDVNVTVGMGGTSGNSNNNNTNTNNNSSNSPTSEELMARIRELQDTLRNLQNANANQVTSASSGTTGTTKSSSPTLSLGSTGPAVTALQKFLVARKFLKMPAGSSYGTFGPATKAALAKFQAAYLIYPANGYYGPITKKLVNQLK